MLFRPPREEDVPPGPLGASLPRVEDDRLLRGKGRFVSDLRPRDCLHLVFVRAVMAPARLVRVDARAGGSLPGVRLVLTGADTAGLGKAAVNALVDGLADANWPILARDRVEAVGQPIALVVADTLAQAQDAAEAVIVDCEPFQESAPVPSFAQEWQHGDVDAAFAQAAHVVRVELEYPRVAPMALEPRAAIAHWHAGESALSLWLSTQTPHRARSDIAAILGLDEAAIRVVAPDVGGAFGGKASLYPEEAGVALAAMRLDRPVGWTATRSEEFLAAAHGRAQKLSGELALAADGRFLALRAEVDAELGHWLTYSAVVPARNAMRILPGPYKIDAVHLRARGHRSMRAPLGIYRGAGRPEAAMLMERLVERAARTLGTDPIVLRRANTHAPADLPQHLPAGGRLDRSDFAELLEMVQRTADYPRLRAHALRRRAEGAVCGIGIALYVEPCGQGSESATLAHDGAGRFTLATGATAQGQGRETAFAQIAADVLGVAPEAVTVVHGDTAATPAGIGALASRSTAIGGSAVYEAARRLVEIAGSTLARGWAAAPACKTAVRYMAPEEAWASGACIASVEIDRDTGVPAIERIVWVDDAGVVVNPMLVDGQLRGGLAQGLGEALMERIVYDAQGQLLTGSLMDYAVPRASDIPPVTLLSCPTPSAANSLGAKGVGEAGTIGVPAAIANAVLDALVPFGVECLDFPLRAETIWRAMQDRGDDR
ncbi:MAG: molybdopterin-dependent oxidoreductase [Alphaproteobacteria bacterium]|nr:molybdopterin-dependent oxidoreductase [Alphaproteobacteria bacterium]